jgi:deoxycytidine triphosphate deaminase
MRKEGFPTLAKEASTAPEVLVDHQILAAIRNGQLIANEADQNSAKYACYELRIGSKVQQLVTEGTGFTEGDLYREKAIPDSGIFTIQPGETFKIFAKEQLYMPADVFAISIPVGNLYKLGLNPETTFADPGFVGDFYITVCNYSARVVKLTVGDPLARLFIFHLAQRPERIHDGRPRNLPPSIERVKRPSDQELIDKGESALLREILTEVDPPHYEHAFVTYRIVSLHRAAANSRIAEIEVQYATITLLSLASFLIVFLLAAFKVGSLLAVYNEHFVLLVLAEIAATVVLAVLVAWVLTPVRKAASSALRMLLNKGADRDAGA